MKRKRASAFLLRSPFWLTGLALLTVSFAPGCAVGESRPEAAKSRRDGAESGPRVESKRQAAESKPAAGDSLYGKHEGPFGYGIFEHMHWGQLKRERDANINNPYVAGALFHFAWAGVEPSKGKLDTQMLDDVVGIWAARGKKIMLNIRTAPGGHKEKTPWKGSSTPEWVYAAGARFVQSSKKGAAQKFPVPWDPVFLAEYQRFLGELSKRYDGHPGIELIVVGPGAFAATTIAYPEVVEDFRKIGYTDRRWFEAILKVADLYKGAFKKTPLMLGVSPFVRLGATEDTEYNNFGVAKQAAARGLGVFYHNLRGTEHWIDSPYPKFLASLGVSTKIALGTDNPSSRSERHGVKYGDLMTTMRHAFGGVNGLPVINTSYLVLYEEDVEAGTRGSKTYHKNYEEAMSWAFEKLTRR